MGNITKMGTRRMWTERAGGRRRIVPLPLDCERKTGNFSRGRRGGTKERQRVTVVWPGKEGEGS